MSAKENVTKDPLLEQSLRGLSAHLHKKWGDRTRMDVFNRLLAKNLRPPGWTKNTHFTFTEAQIKSRQELWSTDRLAGLRLGHSDPSGDDFECPIVIAEYAGEQRLLDGNYRVNRWKLLGDTKEHLVNIHTVVGESELVALPNAA
ncbi:MAG: hypothetical protein EPO19_02500 [Betaproteobacteria bacterium]|nr:MAG: hypothetical protein EPO19_02500 [Betaproteobacteria bacterium]